MAGGFLDSIFAGRKAREAQEAAMAEYNRKEGLINKQEGEEQNLFNKEYYRDITNSADFQNMYRKLQENQNKVQAKNDAVGAISGAAGQQALALQTEGANSFNNSLADVYAASAQQKYNVSQNHLGRMNQLLGMHMQNTNPAAQYAQNTSNQWSQAATGFFKTGANALSGGWDKVTSGVTPYGTTGIA